MPATGTHSVTPLPGIAQAQIQAAFQNFSSIVSPGHQQQFHSTTIKDVWEAARSVEAKLAAKQSSRNLRRLKPFLDGLEHYSKVVEVLCNGTPYLPWIWAPIKLCLMIACDYVEAFEKLIKAYGEIAEALPRFDRFSSLLQANVGFQQVLSLLYCDIIEFHTRAYRFFTDSAWKRFFDTSWKRFDTRFNAVLQSLRQHSDLVDKEAASLGIVASYESLSLLGETRQQIYDLAQTQEEHISEQQLHAVFAWFKDVDFKQEDDFDRLKNKHISGTCDWFFQHKLVKQWLTQCSQLSKLSVYGKPGSGKSVLCVQLTEHLRRQGNSNVVYHLCSFRFPERNTSSAFLRGILAQLIRLRTDLAPFVYHEYLLKGLLPSIAVLRALLTDVAQRITDLTILLDGLDECLVDQQKTLATLCTELTESCMCKIIIFSQELPGLHKRFRKGPALLLGDEKDSIDHAIRLCVHDGLDQIQQDHENLEISKTSCLALEERIVERAEGMFLWVSLVLSSLEEASCLQELEELVERLPRDLEAVYARIFASYERRLSPQHFTRLKKIFNWIAFAERPLREQEILSGLQLAADLGVLNEQTKLNERVLDTAKPLIEVINGKLTLVHFTVQKFLITGGDAQLCHAPDALRDMALACTRSTMSALDFVDSASTDLDVTFGLLNGFYGLHSYASDHWIAHLRRYDKTLSDSTMSSTDGTLALAIDLLYARHERISNMNDEVGQSFDLNFTSHPAFEKLYLSPSALSFVNAAICDSDDISSCGQETSHDQGPSGIIKFTLLHVVDQRFYEQLRALVAPGSEASFPSFDSKLFTNFRKYFAGLAYVCRVKGCHRRSEGFTTDEARLEHEQTHETRIKCPYADCAFASSIGFPSAHALKQHIRRRHIQELPCLPRFKSPVKHANGVAPLSADSDNLQRYYARMSPPTRLGNVSEHEKYLQQLRQPQQQMLTEAQWQQMLKKEADEARARLAQQQADEERALAQQQYHREQARQSRSARLDELQPMNQNDQKHFLTHEAENQRTRADRLAQKTEEPLQVWESELLSTSFQQKNIRRAIFGETRVEEPNQDAFERPLALPDHQLQLLPLGQQNKERLPMARAEGQTPQPGHPTNEAAGGLAGPSVSLNAEPTQDAIYGPLLGAHQMYQDHLFNPDINYDVAPSTTSVDMLLSPRRGLISDRLKSADLARSTARATAPEKASWEQSPFREQDSQHLSLLGLEARSQMELQIGRGEASMSQIRTAANMREEGKQKAAEAEWAQHNRPFQQELTQTISPKETLL